MIPVFLSVKFSVIREKFTASSKVCAFLKSTGGLTIDIHVEESFPVV